LLPHLPFFYKAVPVKPCQSSPRAAPLNNCAFPLVPFSQDNTCKTLAMSAADFQVSIDIAFLAQVCVCCGCACVPESLSAPSFGCTRNSVIVMNKYAGTLNVVRLMWYINVMSRYAGTLNVVQLM